MPGAEQTKTFTISSAAESDVAVTYSIKWTGVSNSFVNDELRYTLSGQVTSQGVPSGQTVSKVEDVKAPTGEEFIGSGVLQPGEKHNYTLTLKFKETGSDQNSNQDKSFTGKIEVTTTDETGNDIYYNASNPSGTSSKPSAEGGE